MQRPLVLKAVVSRIGVPHWKQGTVWLTRLTSGIASLMQESGHWRKIAVTLIDRDFGEQTGDCAC
jgi:hypothetical protein